MQVIYENGFLKVISDYNVRFRTEVKALGGRWERPYWIVPERSEEALRKLLMSIYGEDGTPQPRVTVDVSLDDFLEDIDMGMYTMDGKILAQRYNRDDPVKLGENVVLQRGGFEKAGGSQTKPRVCAKNGTVLRVYDIPIELFNRFRDSSGVTLVTDESARREKLESELARLLDRIDAIREELRELDKKDKKAV